MPTPTLVHTHPVSELCVCLYKIPSQSCRGRRARTRRSWRKEGASIHLREKFYMDFDLHCRHRLDSEHRIIKKWLMTNEIKKRKTWEIYIEEEKNHPLLINWQDEKLEVRMSKKAIFVQPIVLNERERQKISLILYRNFQSCLSNVKICLPCWNVWTGPDRICS